MLQWEINGKVRWLCLECTKANVQVFMLSEVRFLGETDHGEQPCSCCRRHDRVEEKSGAWQWLHDTFAALVGMPSPARVRALRRIR